MKDAPRRAENAVASLLSAKFASIGASPVERIPVIGRIGPDISINELGLVIDVKNRGEVPLGLFHDELVTFGGFLAAPLDRFELLIDGDPKPIDFSSLTVLGYYAHMDVWRLERRPEGITCVILHRSGASYRMKHKAKMPFGKSMVVISIDNRRRLQEKWNKLQTLNSPSFLPATTSV
jgi:hypothetical protein